MALLLFGACRLRSVEDLFPLSLFESCMVFCFVVQLLVCGTSETYMLQKLLIFVLTYTDKKNNRSAMFILGCFQLSVYSLVWVSQGPVEECTGPVDSKAPAQTPAEIPCVFMWNASLNTTQISTLCACFSKQDLQGVHFWLQPTWPMSPSVSHSNSKPQNHSALFPLKNSNQSGSPPATSTKALSFPARTKKDFSQSGI